MPLNTMTFAGIGTYPLDTIWSPGDPRYGECTQHMNASGDWSRGAQPTNRDGTVNYNDDLAGGASYHGVANLDPATGAVNATCNAWDFDAEFAIASWPPLTPGGAPSNTVFFLGVSGVDDPPVPAGATAGLHVGFNRAGNFFTQGQLTTHAESTGLHYAGGALSVHLEVTPHGPWWVQVSVGAGLAYTACGDAWGGGELFGATWGVMGLTGASPTVVLLCPSVAGVQGVHLGPVECPHPPAAGTARTRVFWVPFGE